MAQKKNNKEPKETLITPEDMDKATGRNVYVGFIFKRNGFGSSYSEWYEKAKLKFSSEKEQNDTQTNSTGSSDNQES